MKALVIGGTGPTGPFIINGLIERGYQVAMLNRGSRDSEEIPQTVERIVGDPHFAETLSDALKGRTFDLVVATYGRIRYVAEVMADKTDRFISVGGPPSYRGFGDPSALWPTGMLAPTAENAQLVESESEHRFGYLVRQAEEAVMAQHEAGRFNASHFRYPVVYGPRQIRPATVWWVMRRCLDKRNHMVLANGGMTIITRGYAENMAHAVLLAADQPDASAGQIYNCGDIDQLSLAQWVQVISETMDWPLEVVGVPDPYASPSRDFMPFRGPADHQLLDLHKIRSDLGYQDRLPALEAIKNTVRWYQENPPEETAAFLEELKAHYQTEDQILPIYREASERMGALAHYTQEVHHSYAHPKKPGLVRDHRDR